MRTGQCRCGNRIFFNNHQCLHCQATLGRCTSCGALTSITMQKSASKCDACDTVVHPCNNQTHQVCNSFNATPQKLCCWCEFTNLIPPLHQPDSVSRWAAMEAAKRRLLMQLAELGLPPFIADTQTTHPLTFAFLEDSVDAAGNRKPVTTGHENGVITINLAEADSVHREQVRVELNEPQRTLIGHFRHEVGHYLDWSWASRCDIQGYHRLFGDPHRVDYAAAMQRHYEQGPPADWAEHHVSAYATMHPWEDFAETVNLYLDIMAIASTANDLGGRDFDLSPQSEPHALVEAVLTIVVEVSEYNFDLGLKSLLPERLPPTVLDKLAYIHSLRSQSLVSRP